MSGRLKMVVTLVSLALSLASAGAEYKLVWSDEFDGPGINPANWEHMLGDGTLYGISAGWGNKELQCYTGRPENSFVENGNLVIQALKEEYEGHSYTSARMRTAKKQDFLYGKIEARIKLPSEKGLWPAFWLMPTESAYGPWPQSGEVDICEAVNKSPDRVMGSIFFGSTSGTKHISRFFVSAEQYGAAQDLAADYHIYTVEWQPYEMRWFVDGKLYSVQHDWFSADNPYPAPFNKLFHIILNIAVGGAGPGAPPDKTSTFPARMYVDWVRVYQTDNQPPELEILSPANEENIPGGEDVLIKVKASDPNGKIDRVEFYNSGTLIGKVSTPPYTLAWKAPDGCYTISVRAVDDADFAHTKTVKITKGIGCPPGPYYEKPAEIPGRLEAENFDRGLPGKAYFDTDEANQGERYRLDVGVDIQDCSEGGYDIGWTAAGEWLEYTVNVAKAGSYDIIFRVGSPEGAGKLHLEFDGVDKTGVLDTPKTGDWQKYTNLTAHNVKLKAGKQVMRLVIDAGSFNLNYIDVAASSNGKENTPKQEK